MAFDPNSFSQSSFSVTSWLFAGVQAVRDFLVTLIRRRGRR